MSRIVPSVEIHIRHRYYIKCTMMIVGVFICIAGCNNSWRPSLDHMELAPQAKELSLADYLKANRIGYWTYHRRSVPATEDQPATVYTRRSAINRFREGQLLRTALLPLDSYIWPADIPASQPVSSPKPVATFPEGMGIYVELEKPLAVVPEDLQLATPISESTIIHYYNDKGKVQAQGTLSREVEIDGYEDIECPAGQFEHCMRIRVDLKTQISWFLHVTWSSYMWLSPTVGEVRRVHSFSGAWFFVFWFQSAHEYLLVNYHRVTDRTISKEQLSPKWKWIAMVFDRGIPKPRFSGMVVDYCTSQPVP